MYISSVLTVILNVLLVFTHACPKAKCQVMWTPADYPNPRSQSGRCGRGCSSTFVCDPCSIIGKHEGTHICICKIYISNGNHDQAPVFYQLRHILSCSSHHSFVQCVILYNMLYGNHLVFPVTLFCNRFLDLEGI